MHCLAVYGADGTLIGWAAISISSAQVDGAGSAASATATPIDLAATGGALPATALSVGILLVLLGTMLLMRRRWRVVDASS